MQQQRPTYEVKAFLHMNLLYELIKYNTLKEIGDITWPRGDTNDFSSSVEKYFTRSL